MIALAILLAINTVAWRPIQNGVELATFEVGQLPSGAKGRLYAVRIDPARAKVRAVLASEQKSAPRTAEEWCRSHRLSVAINMGMFQSDQRSNVGYLRSGAHVNNPRWNAYRSIMAV